MVTVDSMIVCSGNPKKSLKNLELESQTKGLKGSKSRASFSMGVHFRPNIVPHWHSLTASYRVRS